MNKINAKNANVIKPTEQIQVPEIASFNYRQAGSSLISFIKSCLINSTSFKFNLPLDLIPGGFSQKNFNIYIPNAFLWLIGISCSLHLFRQVNKLKNSLVTWTYSFFNSQQYLSPLTDKISEIQKNQNDSLRAPSSGPGIQESSEKAYAVIYGANNKAGKAFSQYLMEKGFNLILIERDGDSLQALEEQLRKLLPERNPIIIRIVLNKFDKDSINWSVCKYSTYPVKIFVNCKTSKKAPAQQKKFEDPVSVEERKKKILKESLINESFLKDFLVSDEIITSFEISSTAEVHYNGKENIEGFASLLIIFLRSMLLTSKQPCLINIDNVDSTTQNNPKSDDDQIFYSATIDFKDKFTSMISKKFKSIKSINVKTSFKNMPDGISQRAANKLCGKTFAYIGLQEVIYV